MTEAARTPSCVVPGVDERARWVENAVHSLRMEGLKLSSQSASDAQEYVAGRLTLDEYGRQTRARYGLLG